MNRCLQGAQVPEWITERKTTLIQKDISKGIARNNCRTITCLPDGKTLVMAWIDSKKAYDIVPQGWIINCLKVYKILYNVMDFMEKTMKTWRVELTVGGRSLAEAKIKRGIFQGDSISPLIFIIAMMPLNHILRKCTAGYKLSGSQEKINHLMCMDDMKLFAKSEKKNPENFNTRSGNIQSWHRDGM